MTSILRYFVKRIKSRTGFIIAVFHISVFILFGTTANFTYTKYDADTTPEDKPKKAREFYKKNMNVSVKHNSTITPAKKKEEVSEKKHEASADKEKDLDKKLNDILGGGDLKL